MFIQTVCQSLDRHRVKHAVVGGYAVALHGAVRGTIDVDIALQWNLKNLKAAEAALQAIGLQSRLPITAEDVFRFRDEYIHNRNLIAWNFVDLNDPSKQVDIIINYDLAGHGVETIQSGANRISVLALADLIKMKRESGREQDLADIKTLEYLLKGEKPTK